MPSFKEVLKVVQFLTTAAFWFAVIYYSAILS